MRSAVICAIFLAIIVTVIEAESGRRREMVRGGRSRERKVSRRKIGAEKTSRGEAGRKRKQMRRGRKLEGRASIVVKGNDCEFIYLADITSNSGCSNGQKFVLKGANNTRKQFLIVNDKAIIAFITKRKKFTACESFTDITTSVSCKSVSGLDNVTLPSSSSNSSSNSTGTATTAAGGAASTTAAASNTTTAAPAASNTTSAAAAANTTAVASNATSASNSSGEEGEDDIEATVKSLIDAGTCDGVTYATDATTDECGDAATSYYKEFVYNGKRVIVSNNIPDHPAEQDTLAPNPNIRCSGWQFVQLEVDPEVADTVTDTGLGTIGLAVTGGAFFNHLSNPDGSLAMPNEGPSLDSCLGHSAPIMGGGEGGAPGGPGGPPGGGPPGGGPPGGGPPGGRFKRQTEEEDVPHGGIYHYHGNLNCTDAGSATGANDPDQCLLLGYYLDGVPVYGLCKDPNNNNMMMTSCYSLNPGVATSSITAVFGTYDNLGANQDDYTYASSSSCNLDEASGAIHPSTGKYSYFMTTDYPWIPIKFMAERSTICGFTP